MKIFDLFKRKPAVVYDTTVITIHIIKSLYGKYIWNMSFESGPSDVVCTANDLKDLLDGYFKRQEEESFKRLMTAFTEDMISG